MGAVNRAQKHFQNFCFLQVIISLSQIVILTHLLNKSYIVLSVPHSLVHFVARKKYHQLYDSNSLLNIRCNDAQNLKKRDLSLTLIFI